MVSSFSGKRNHVLMVVIISFALLVVCAWPATAHKERHWAWESAQALVDKGVASDELRQYLTDDSWKQLDAPIGPQEWRNWVRQALTLELGQNLAVDEDKSFWVDTYTWPEHAGPRSVVSRGFVVAGLMKTGNLLGFIPGSRQGPLVYLQQFNDWRKVEEQGFSGPWELMLAAGIVNGYPDGTLRPEAPLTRAEAACLLKSWLDVYNTSN